MHYLPVQVGYPRFVLSCLTQIRLVGSEAVEAAMKLARQFFLEQNPPQVTRHRFIARQGSWHGCTIGALAVGDFKVRKDIFSPILPKNTSRVSACNSYRGMHEGESTEEYVARLAEELDNEFQRVGAENVCAFIAEPVAGSVGTLSYVKRI